MVQHMKLDALLRNIHVTSDFYQNFVLFLNKFFGNKMDDENGIK